MPLRRFVERGFIEFDPAILSYRARVLPAISFVARNQEVSGRAERCVSAARSHNPIKAPIFPFAHCAPIVSRQAVAEHVEMGLALAGGWN